MNYAAHNKELHGTLKRPDEPVIFTKADSALLNQGKPFFIPDHLGRIDYETEVVVRICRLGKNIPERFAHRYYDAVTLGIDFTARDLQRKASEAGQPWTICKGFDGSAAIGEWVPKEKFLDIQRLHFHLDINGKTVQEGCTSDMLYKDKQEQAVKWRENAREKVKEQNLVKARTAVMAGYVKTFVELYPDKEPDEVKLTVKVVE